MFKYVKDQNERQVHQFLNADKFPCDSKITKIKTDKEG